MHCAPRPRDGVIERLHYTRAAVVDGAHKDKVEGLHHAQVPPAGFQGGGVTWEGGRI